MRYERVNAFAFGPFRDEKLELTPGMNVIHGRNEAGKSSWHAALYAGLCGMRRAKGKPRKEDQAFAERHRPWNQDGDWEVGAVIELDKIECRVELRHDLVRRMGSVEDAEIAGRDYSNERMYDGAVDGSLWLGLNRELFRATACVRQSAILGVREGADFLQDAIQKAAAGVPKDATAAAALVRLQDYRRDHVGTLNARTKPLARTKAEVAAMRANRDKACRMRDEYRSRRADVDEHGKGVTRCRGMVGAAKAMLAMEEAVSAERNLSLARWLMAKISETPEPPSSERALAARVENALDGWEKLPEITDLTGRSVDVIQSEIHTEDRPIASSRAVLAEREAEKAERRLARAQELSPKFPDGAPRSVAQDDELAENVNQALIDWKNRPRPADLSGSSADETRVKIDTEKRKLVACRAAAAEHDAQEAEGHFGRMKRAGRMGYLILSVAFLAIVVAAPKWLAVAVLVLPGIWWARKKTKHIRERAVIARQRAQELRRAADESYLTVTREQNVTGADLPRIEAEHDRRRVELKIKLDRRVRAEQQWNDDRKKIQTAAEQLARVAEKTGICEESPARLATQLNGWREAHKRSRTVQGKRLELWGEYQALLDGQSLEGVREEALRKREGASDLLDHPLLGSAAEILVRARDRTSQELSELERRARKNLKRLGKELDRRGRAEEQRRGDEAQIARAQTELVRVANEARVVSVEDPEELASTLNEWLRNHRERVERAGTLQELRDEFHRLVGERSLSEFAAEVESLNQQAQELAAQVADATLADAKDLQPDSSMLEDLQRRLEIAKVDLAEKRGQLQAFRETLINVADAEDALAAAKREHERVLRLGATLDRVTEFLETAQDEVFRTIAPILRSTVREWLPRVTDGRYDDCRVNPETLLVEVRATSLGAPWRDAGLLSHGTAEQIYLLLRLALSSHLGDRDESCPLILDDPVASSDTSRKQAVLDTLYTISKAVQVILFSHEDDVRDWARERLSRDSRHCLIELQTVGS